MEIKPEDVEFTWGGCSVEKVKRLSDEQLLKIETELTEKIDSVSWANIEEMHFLTIGFSFKHIFSEEEKIKIAQIIDRIINI